ncbi:MAG TPA: hypothetical protein PKD90_08485 [Phnomibacter sp.]|nr:hypothetical protein [Phnomibacter sp.]
MSTIVSAIQHFISCCNHIWILPKEVDASKSLPVLVRVKRSVGLKN